MAGQLLPGHQSFRELDFIARFLACSSEETLQKLAVAAYRAKTLPEYINAIGNIDRCLFLSGIQNEYDVGKGIQKFPESVISFLDYRKVGIECMASHSIHNCTEGTIVHDEKPDRLSYDGLYPSRI